MIYLPKLNCEQVASAKIWSCPQCCGVVSDHVCHWVVSSRAPPCPSALLILLGARWKNACHLLNCRASQTTFTLGLLWQLLYVSKRKRICWLLFLRKTSTNVCVFSPAGAERMPVVEPTAPWNKHAAKRLGQMVFLPLQAKHGTYGSTFYNFNFLTFSRWLV